MKTDIFEHELKGGNFSRFITPSILMMVLISFNYTIDTIFVANLVGEEGLAAINIAYPVQGLMWGVCVMLAAGSSALVSIALGKGDREDANSKFTFVSIAAIGLGLVFTVIGLIFLTPIVNVLGATEALTEDCHIFLQLYLFGCPAAFIGVIYEFFIRVDGRPAFTIALYIAGGVTHLGFDIILMGPLHMGLRGAALANILGLTATALMGLVYFLKGNNRLRYSRFKADWKYIGHSFVNGLPEFVNESSAGIMVFCYNLILVRLAGETGVAASAVVLQIHYLFMSVHIGYQVGTMPLISYYYGGKQFEKINKVLRYTKRYIIVTSFGMAGICLLAAPLIAGVYTDRGTELFEMSVEGLRIASISLFTVGVNVFVSGFFTCYGSGAISATISLSRGLVMILIGLFALSHFFGVTGTWMALPFADITTLALSFIMMNKYKSRYNYRVLG